MKNQVKTEARQLSKWADSIKLWTPENSNGETEFEKKLLSRAKAANVRPEGTSTQATTKSTLPAGPWYSGHGYPGQDMKKAISIVMEKAGREREQYSFDVIVATQEAADRIEAACSRDSPGRIQPNPLDKLLGFPFRVAASKEAMLEMAFKLGLGGNRVLMVESVGGNLEAKILVLPKTDTEMLGCSAETSELPPSNLDTAWFTAE